MKTQPVAPPIVPPRRPIVGLAMADDDDRGAQIQRMAEFLARCQAELAATRALLDRHLEARGRP